MAAQPIENHFTSRELACSGYVAAGLWIVSAILAIMLVVWVSTPQMI